MPLSAVVVALVALTVTFWHWGARPFERRAIG